MNWCKPTIGVMGLGLTLWAAGWSAGATLVAITSPTTDITDNGAYTVGYDFTVGSQALVVNALGVWDENTDGLLVSHPVGIWTTTGTLLASLTVPAGTAGTLVGEYRYADLTPSLILAPGTSYRIGGLTGTDDYHGSVFIPSANAPTFATPDVNFVQRRGDLSGIFVFPNQSSLNNPGASAWDFPNFEYVLIPEPSLALLLGLGGGLLAWRARRHSRPAAPASSALG